MTTPSAQVSLQETETVGIDEVVPHPENARQGNIDRIEKSLRTHGQYKPLVVHQSTGHILVGNNTWRVMKEKLGLTHVAVTRVHCSDAQARAILATDNRSSDSSSYDNAALLALLGQVEEDGFLSAAGFSRDDLDDLSAALDEVSGQLAEVVPFERPGFLGDGDREEPTVADRAAGYAESDTRAIVLTLSGPEYVELNKNLEKLGEILDLTTNTETIVRAVQIALEHA